MNGNPSMVWLDDEDSMMKAMKFLIVFVYLLVVVPSSQVMAQDALFINRISSDMVGKFLQEQGYSYTLSSESVVIWKIDGMSAVLVIPENGESVQFYASVSGSNSTLEKVNDWNKTKRFSRSYLDKDGDPVLELDLDLAGGITKSRFIDFLKTCRTSFSVWINEVAR